MRHVVHSRGDLNAFACAVQIVGAFRYQGMPQPAGSWVVMFPGGRDVVPDSIFRNRYREVIDGSPHQDIAETPDPHAP